MASHHVFPLWSITEKMSHATETSASSTSCWSLYSPHTDHIHPKANSNLQSVLNQMHFPQPGLPTHEYPQMSASVPHFAVPSRQSQLTCPLSSHKGLPAQHCESSPCYKKSSEVAKPFFSFFSLNNGFSTWPLCQHHAVGFIIPPSSSHTSILKWTWKIKEQLMHFITPAFYSGF